MRQTSEKPSCCYTVYQHHGKPPVQLKYLAGAKCCIMARAMHVPFHFCFPPSLPGISTWDSGVYLRLMTRQWSRKTSPPLCKGALSPTASQKNHHEMKCRLRNTELSLPQKEIKRLTCFRQGSKQLLCLVMSESLEWVTVIHELWMYVSAMNSQCIYAK